MQAAEPQDCIYTQIRFLCRHETFWRLNLDVMLRKRFIAMRQLRTRQSSVEEGELQKTA